MDQQLRELERAAAEGDRDAQIRLENAQCRTNGHQWVAMTYSNRKWMLIEVCSNCLACKGTRAEDIRLQTNPEDDSSGYFSYCFFPEKEPQCYHIVSDFTLHHRYSSRIHLLCGSRHSIFIADNALIASSSQPATCKRCLRSLNSNSAQVKRTGQQLLESCLRAYQASRNKA